MSQSPNHLIIVPGHASFMESVTDIPDNAERDNWWVLQTFQQGEPPYYIEHIKAGIELLKDDPDSLLLFSGGRTRPQGGHWSEAATYAAIAKHDHYWNDTDSEEQDLEVRIGLEEYARDSFENLECSLYRFYQLLGSYPVHIMVVGWQFKAERFALHAQTLGIPQACFTYVGWNNPANMEGALRGEEKTLAQFHADPYGLQSPLADKRLERNPFNIPNPYIHCPPIEM